jgi:type II secretory pathway pseudopilin PulG
VGRQRGFGYLLMLFALAALGLLMAGAGQVWYSAAQRDKETELLFIGNQYRQAITSYYALKLDEKNEYPQKLEDLLEDHRLPMRYSHLRKLYRDPMTGTTEWGLVKAGDRIVGVHSLARGKPIRTVFKGRDTVFAETTRYDQWVFSHDTTGGTP